MDKLTVIFLFVVVFFTPFFGCGYSYGKQTQLSIRSTSGTGIYLDSDNEIELREYPNFVFREYLFGVYSLPSFKLALFPNGKYIVTERCDFCREKVVYLGGFEYLNGILRLKDDNNKLASVLFNEPDREQVTLKLFAIFHNYTFISSVLVKTKDVDSKIISQYLERDVPYFDWEQEYENLLKRKKQQSQGNKGG